MENINIQENNKLGDRRLLEMIHHAASGEAAAAKFYSRLSERLTGRDKKIVHDIALDEAKHRRLFEELYTGLSGQRMPPLKEDVEETEPVGELTDIFEERTLEELADVEFYRHIYFALVSIDYRDVLFEIITDEQRHANIMTLLYSKYINKGM